MIKFLYDMVSLGAAGIAIGSIIESHYVYAGIAILICLISQTLKEVK